MYTLQNDQLTVAILDPIADQKRLGSRYCTGGYIYQISDAAKGNLLSGPHYPAPEPNVFDGQGAPDMFFTPLLPGDVPVDGEVGCIGVGRVRRTSPREPFDVRFNPEVIEFLPWSVSQEADEITMKTEQGFHDWAYTLSRQVRLQGRCVHSRTAIANSGKAILPVKWFAHPFFPLTPDNVLCRFSIPLQMPETPGYFFDANGYVCRRPEFDWTKGGCYLPFTPNASGSGISVMQKHPLVGEVKAVTDFMPGFLPVWGNDKTFSFEPYFIRDLAPGETAVWSIEYNF
jgi:hypothetical protein